MIQLGELTNTCVKIYQVIRSLQMLTVIFALKSENATKMPPFTVHDIRINNIKWLTDDDQMIWTW